VLKLIEERSEQLHETNAFNHYSIEDIEKEVEETLNKSLSDGSRFSAFNLDIKEDETVFVHGKTLKESPQDRIEIKDSIREVESLQSAINGKVKVNDYAIDLTTKMLSATMKQQTEEQNKKMSNKLKMKLNSMRR